jgi:hypothetical protein
MMTDDRTTREVSPTLTGWRWPRIIDWPADPLAVYMHQSIENMANFGFEFTFLPSTWPVSLRPWRNAATMGAWGPGDVPLRNPTTGVAACCALAASDHAAAAPLSSATKVPTQCGKQSCHRQARPTGKRFAAPSACQWPDRRSELF